MDVIKKTLEAAQISTRDISVFEHFYVKSFIEKKDFTKEIEKYFLSESTSIQKAMDKIFKFTLEIAKGLIISYVTK